MKNDLDYCMCLCSMAGGIKALFQTVLKNKIQNTKGQ